MKFTSYLILAAFLVSAPSAFAAKKKVSNSAAPVATPTPAEPQAENDSEEEDEVPAPYSFLAQVGVDIGGDDAFYVIRNNGTRDNVRYGDGAFVSLGMLFRLAESSTGMVQLQPTIGFKYFALFDSNQSITLTRFPVEMMAFYLFSFNLRAGVGVKYDLAPHINADGTLLNQVVSITAKPGFVMQVDYWFNDRFAFGARYTMMKYDVPTMASQSADSFGLVGTFSP